MEPVTVILNVWRGDALRSIQRSVKSILAQTHQPEELLIVVDGPLEDSVDKFISSITAQTSIPVRFVRIEAAQGLWNARNVGLKEARTELVALQDADDVMHPQRLELQTYHLKKGNYDVLGTACVEFDEQSGLIIGIRRTKNTVFEVRHQARWVNPLNHSSIMLRRASVLDCGGYRDVHFAEDYDLWLRMIGAGLLVTNCAYLLQALAVDAKLLRRRGGLKFVKSELMIDKTIRDQLTHGILFRLSRLTFRLIYRVGPMSIRRIGQHLVLRRQYSLVGGSTLEHFLRVEPTNLSK